MEGAVDSYIFDGYERNELIGRAAFAPDQGDYP